jgi:beta-carotene 3-hydroxylase
MLLKVGIVLFFFVLMEGVAWFTHKYIMHGIGWGWHRDHHQHHTGFFERNDYYAVVFSFVSIFLIFFGLENEQYWYTTYAGMGVTLYGVSYFVFHDLIVHRRIKFKYVAKWGYMKRIMNAHYVHHKVHTKEGAEAFGFLFALGKYDLRKKSKSS